MKARSSETRQEFARNTTNSIRELFEQYVVPSYARFDLVLERGEGSHVWDANGKRYLDLGGGIAVCALGHAHPEITEALVEQSKAGSHFKSLLHRTAGTACQTNCRSYRSGANLLM